MTSQRTVLLLTGRLRGMGCEADCIVRPALIHYPGFVPGFGRCTIEEAPPELPEGEYTVTYEGRTERVRKEGLAWLPFR
jgi:hypothetical protein